MTSETGILTHTVEGTSRDVNLARSVGEGLLEALRKFRGITAGKAEVLVFTDSTPGHIWKILIEKHSTAGGTSSFRFSATHLPAPCNPYCEPEPRHVGESDWLNELYEVLAYDIACAAREEETVSCCPA